MSDDAGAAAAGAAGADASVPQVKGLYHVLPYLYMGDGDAACNKAELQRLGISVIVNCASDDVDNMFPEDFAYTAFPIEDTHDAEPSAHFQTAFEVLSEVKESKRKALVHCTTGKNIAPTIVLAHMLKSSHKIEKHLPLSKALAFVQSKAPGARPTEQFMAQLVDLEVELFEDASVRVPGRRGGGSGRGRNGRGGKGRRGH